MIEKQPEIPVGKTSRGTIRPWGTVLRNKANQKKIGAKAFEVAPAEDFATGEGAYH